MGNKRFFLALCWLYLVVCKAGLTPSQMVGVCTASCASNPMFPCIYTPTYPVEFLSDGAYSWRAPYANGSGVEVGYGLILSEVHETRWANGSWSARWYGGNTYRPDPTYTTHCACYYVTGSPNGSFEIVNYPVKEATNTSTKASVREVCDTYFTHCPVDEADAYQKFGAFWAEQYEGCGV